MKHSDTVQAGLILVCGMVTAGAGYALASPAASAHPWGLEHSLGVGLSVLGVVTVGLWVLTLGVALVTELLRQRSPSAAVPFLDRCTPALMRRLAAALLGVNLLAAPAVGHAASDPGAGTAVPGLSAAQPWTGTSEPVATDDVAAACRLPTRAPALTAVRLPRSESVSTAPAAESSEAAESPAWKPAPIPSDGGLLIRAEGRTPVGGSETVVAPGDSLWSIAARRLGPLATAADIAEAWPAWYEANRSVIGEDPSFLLPGQVLRAP